VARIIHELEVGRRAVHQGELCALPDNLLESELFGYEKALSQERQNPKWAGGEAEGGSIFLDEIGELSLSLQGQAPEGFSGTGSSKGWARRKPVKLTSE